MKLAVVAMIKNKSFNFVSLAFFNFNIIIIYFFFIFIPSAPSFIMNSIFAKKKLFFKNPNQIYKNFETLRIS